MEARKKFTLLHASSGHKHALTEILSQPAVQAKLMDTKYSSEVKALGRFYKMLNDDASRAFYSYKHVQKALEMGAIDTLLITDSLFRSPSIQTRRKYIALVDAVKAQGGTVLIFSSQHETGERLDGLSGIAALLKFGIEEPEGDAQEEELEVFDEEIEGLQEGLDDFEDFDMDAFQ